MTSKKHGDLLMKIFQNLKANLSGDNTDQNGSRSILWVPNLGVIPKYD